MKSRQIVFVIGGIMSVIGGVKVDFFMWLFIFGLYPTIIAALLQVREDLK